MKQLSFTVAVQGGKCQFSEQHLQAIRAYLEPLEGRAVTVSWKRPQAARSLKQNSYLWGVAYQYIAAQCGHSPEEVHYWLKEELLPRKFITIAGKEREQRKSTTELNVKEMAEYIDAVIAWAGRELGVSIPPPN